MLEWAASRVADRLVAVGREQLQAISKAYGLPADRLEVVVNGVETAEQKSDVEWNSRLASGGRVVIGTICTFIEQKGLPDLLRVAAALKARNERALFVVVGDGPLRAEIEHECRQLGLHDYVLFAGWKPEAPATMMPLFDVFFQPSLWEAMSMVVLEAMAAGKPVVVTDVGDNRHVVCHGETGFVVPARDVDAMANALRQLICSVERRGMFGQAGRHRYAANYTAQTMTRRYEVLYREVLEGFGKEGNQECVE
jgi:glycosyltransferase involved in cell wall biosynthesis